MQASVEPGPCPGDFGLDIDPARLSTVPDGQALVVEAFSRFSPDWAKLAPRIAFKPDCYARCRLYADETVEVLLLCWLPGQSTPVHDHGTSWGVSMPLCGGLLESSFQHRGDGVPLERTARAPLTFGAIALERSDTIHQIENASSAPVVSLHVYSPPLSSFGTYDIETGTTKRITPPVESCR